MKEFWIYTGLRVGLFLGTAAVLWGVLAVATDGRVDLLLVLLVAAVISTVLSWKLLAAPRARLAASIDARAHRATSRFEQMRTREDDESSAGQ